MEFDETRLGLQGGLWHLDWQGLSYKFSSGRITRFPMKILQSVAVRVILTVIGTFVAFLLVSLFALAIYVYWNLPSVPWPVVIKDVWRYRQIVHPDGSELMNHFPEKIPENAMNVRFYYEPGFLQGGMVCQVRMQLPYEEIKELYYKFAKQKTVWFWGGGKFGPQGMPATDFYTGDGDRRFPDDYGIMILDRVIPEAERKGDYFWNHGSSHGVAISLRREEIIYWAESW